MFSQSSWDQIIEQRVQSKAQRIKNKGAIKKGSEAPFFNEYGFSEQWTVFCGQFGVSTLYSTISTLLFIWQYNLKENYTATGALIPGWGSQPSKVKSSYLKSRMSLTFGLIFMVGKARGVLVNCKSTCSM